MTEQQKEFCTKVAHLCESADAINLYRPVMKLWALYEDAATSGTNEPNTKILNVDMNKVSSDELGELQAEVTKSLEAKKAVEDAQKNQSEVNSALANKLNAEANAEQTENPNGQV